MSGLMTIGKVAAAAGVSADTIRYYERVGLLPRPARTASGYRQYAPAVVNRLTVIRNAQRFGFSLNAIAGFLRTREAGGTPCHDVRAAAQRILDAVDSEIRDLVATRAEMRRTLRQWDRLLAATPPGRQARLLEALRRPRLRARRACGIISKSADVGP
jgi:MerR family mercuric resistance operon transcriptional regulator